MAETQPTPEQEKLKFEIFKLEYEQAAQRYENIYKAIWQIFSYMAALAAAILAFGASNIPVAAALSIALLPLLFWFYAIYTPMDFYGKQDIKRLTQIETNFNEEFLSKTPNRYMDHYSGFDRSGLDRREDKPKWRVKQAVKFVAIIASIIFVVSFITAVNSFINQTEPITRSMKITLGRPVQVQLQDFQLRELNEELESFSEKLDRIESLLRARNIASPNNIGKPRE